ncbi:MAG: nucleotidyltransferase domain-containing protein, partial [Candidatus Woesearchaeota archaeon]
YITLKHEYSMTFYTLSDQFPVHEKRLYNMYCLYASGLLTYLGREYAGCTIYIFGSYSKGEDISSSDIDICVIGSTQEIPVDKYEKKLYRRISFHLFMHQQDIHAHLLSSIIGGFCVQGGFVF